MTPAKKPANYIPSLLATGSMSQSGDERPGNKSLLSGLFLLEAEGNMMVDANLPLEKRVKRHLTQSTYPSLRQVGCLMEGDKLVLAGEVESFHIKQLASSLATQIAGYGRVENRLQVDGSQRRA